MASAGGGRGGGGGGEQQSSSARLLSIPKEGERIIAPTRRPDGTFRKAIRIRAGYVPQEEVAIYQSKGALLRKSQPEVPPGCDPELLVKPKSKSAKRNERKKEKRQQAALAAALADKGGKEDSESIVEQGSTSETNEKIDSITDQINSVAISETLAVPGPTTDSSESSKPELSTPDIDKKIRAIKKKIRLAEAQLQGDPQNMKPEQLEKLNKMEGWHEELRVLEEIKANNNVSS